MMSMVMSVEVTPTSVACNATLHGLPVAAVVVGAAAAVDVVAEAWLLALCEQAQAAIETAATTMRHLNLFIVPPRRVDYWRVAFTISPPLLEGRPARSGS